MAKQKIVNKSGIEVLEYNILVQPPEQKDHIFKDPITGREMRIHKPDEYKDREQVSATRGVVLDVSPTAFTFIEGAPLVEIGDEVLFPRHAAMIVQGEDEQKYFILKDKDIAGVIRQQKKAA